MQKVYLNIFRQYMSLGIDFLFKYGFLNSIHLTLKYLATRIQFHLRLARVISLPPNIYLMMTKRCNLDCSFCHYVGELDFVNDVNTQTELTLEDIKDFERTGVLKPPSRVCLYGGEPMLNKSFFEVVEYLNEKSYLSSTITNGTYLKKNLKKLVESPLHQITVSYYEGIANRFEEEIRTLSEVSIINISVIVSKDTIDSLEKVIQFAIRARAKFITIENIIEKAGCERKAIISNDKYHDLKRKLLHDFSSKIIFRWSEVNGKEKNGKEKISCSEPWDMVLIGKEGRVLPCCQYPLEKFGKPESDLNKIFNTPDLVNMRTQMKKGEVPPLCNGCHYLYAKDPLYTFND